MKSPLSTQVESDGLHPGTKWVHNPEIYHSAEIGSATPACAHYVAFQRREYSQNRKKRYLPFTTATIRRPVVVNPPLWLASMLRQRLIRVQSHLYNIRRIEEEGGARHEPTPLGVGAGLF